MLLFAILTKKAGSLKPLKKGIAAAERGEFIEEEEMDARLERMFQSDAHSLDCSSRRRFR
jgi:predicted transcriptional regulator